jgi:hypothetical protein
MGGGHLIANPAHFQVLDSKVVKVLYSSLGSIFFNLDRIVFVFVCLVLCFSYKRITCEAFFYYTAYEFWTVCTALL